jgi:hypothetical protein
MQKLVMDHHGKGDDENIDGENNELTLGSCDSGDPLL